MQSIPNETIRLFCAYVKKDEKHYKEFRKHLGSQIANITLKITDPEDVFAGDNTEETITHHLQSAQIVILFLSPDFVYSKDSERYSEWMNKSKQMSNEIPTKSSFIEAPTIHRQRFIPIKVRPVELMETAYSKLRLLPKQSESVTTVKNRDRIWQEVAQDVKKSITHFHNNPPECESPEPNIPELNPLELRKWSFRDPRNDQETRDLALALQRRGQEHYEQGKYEDAAEIFEKVYTYRQRLIDKSPEQLSYRLDMCASRYWLGHLKYLSGDYTGARHELEAGLELSNRMQVAAPKDGEIRRSNLSLLCELGTTLMELKEYQKAEGMLQRGLLLAEELNSLSPGINQNQRDLAAVLLRMGELLLRTGRTSQALEEYRRAAEICATSASGTPTSLRVIQLHGLALIGCGDVHIREGQIAEGINCYTQAESILNDLVSRDKSNIQWLYFSAVPYRKKGLILSSRGTSSEALEAYARSAAALDTASSLSDCVTWRVELIEHYAMVWDLCRRVNTDHPFAFTYATHRAQHLYAELNRNTKIPAEMKGKVQSLITGYPRLFPTEAQ